MSRAAPPPRILRAAEVDRLRRADAILHAAEAARQATEADAARAADALISDTRSKALRESARAAARMIARAEAAAEQRLAALEPELARMVALTVRRIVGDYAEDEATYHAALTALRQMRDHRKGRIFAAPDVIAPVTRAAADAGEAGPEIVGLHPDPALGPGRAVLTSDHGSAEIGLRALTDQALKPWEDGTPAASAAPPAPAPAPPPDREGSA